MDSGRTNPTGTCLIELLYPQVNSMVLSKVNYLFGCLPMLETYGRRRFQFGQALPDHFRPDVHRGSQLEDFFLEPGPFAFEIADAPRKRSPARFHAVGLHCVWHCITRLPLRAVEFKFCAKRESTRMKVS